LDNLAISQQAITVSTDLVTGAPNAVEHKQPRELGVKVAAAEQK
jgi:hypothetical protein